MKTFENSDVKSITCHRFQSKSEQLSKMADGLAMLLNTWAISVPSRFCRFQAVLCG